VIHVDSRELGRKQEPTPLWNVEPFPTLNLLLLPSIQATTCDHHFHSLEYTNHRLLALKINTSPLQLSTSLLLLSIIPLTLITIPYNPFGSWAHSKIYSRRNRQTSHPHPLLLFLLALIQLLTWISRVLLNHSGHSRLNQTCRGILVRREGEALDRGNLGRRGTNMGRIAQTNRIARDERTRQEECCRDRTEGID